jgi:CxxC motif-containing protein (DUF1111 family)
MDILSDVAKFAAYMRLLAPPEPSRDMPGGSASIEKGRNLFKTVGCAYCHTPQFMTGTSDIPQLDRGNRSICIPTFCSIIWGQN